MTAARPLLLDATAALAADSDDAVLEIAGVLARASLLRGIVRVARGGLSMIDASEVAKDGPPLSAVRSWLLGGPRPTAAKPARRSLAGWPGRPSAVPAGAVLLKPGVAGWSDPAFLRWLDRRPNVSAVALLDKPVGLDWPEYVDDRSHAALRAGLDALSRRAHAAVVPDEAARAWMDSALAGAGRSAIPVHVVEPPSVLAGTAAPPADPALSAVPYLVCPGRIEDRANTLLLLQIWRDLIRSGEPVPKLVLAGRRGRQIEEIKPLLDWNEAVAAAVAEASGLTPEALRHLIVHARAVLSPAFAGAPAALQRDARMLGTPVIAAPRQSDARGDDGAIDPIDGPAWRTAILAAARRAVADRPAVVLPDGEAYLRRIIDLLWSAADAAQKSLARPLTSQSP